MNHVQKVETNIKGHRAATELGQYTLLVGPNESGKSRIAEAIQLALSGSAWGLLWRAKTVKSGSQLDALRPGEEAGVSGKPHSQLAGSPAGLCKRVRALTVPELTESAYQ